MEDKVIIDDVNGITFPNGDRIWTTHEQDCCENVYACWSALEDTTFTDEVGYKYLWVNRHGSNKPYIDFEFVKGVGFRINGYLVPCYNEQNGYYSDELILHYSHDGIEETFDVTECNYDMID